MQMSLSAEERSKCVQRRQGTPGRRVLNSGWWVGSVVMLPPNVDASSFFCEKHFSQNALSAVIGIVVTK